MPLVAARLRSSALCSFSVTGPVPRAPPAPTPWLRLGLLVFPVEASVPGVPTSGVRTFESAALGLGPVGPGVPGATVEPWAEGLTDGEPPVGPPALGFVPVAPEAFGVAAEPWVEGLIDGELLAGALEPERPPEAPDAGDPLPPEPPPAAPPDAPPDELPEDPPDELWAQPPPGVAASITRIQAVTTRRMMTAPFAGERRSGVFSCRPNRVVARAVPIASAVAWKVQLWAPSMRYSDSEVFAPMRAAASGQ